MTETVRPHQEHAELRLRRRSLPAGRLVRAIGPVTILGGIVWGVLQPYRIVFLTGDAQSAYDWVAQPPLLVIAVGALYALVVAPGLIRDLEDERSAR